MDDHEKQLKVLLLDLRNLKESCNTDFNHEIWGNWPDYVNEFNRLRSDPLISKYTEIPDIKHVPSRELSAMHGVGMGMPIERAKIREIESQTNRIIQRLELEYTKVNEHISPIDTDSVLRLIFNKFHTFVVQLRQRYNNRPSIDVDDEYDVQDLLHALLKMYFLDIRKEEWTPNYAGKSTRMDFLLKPEKTVVEVKKTRSGIKDKHIGDQLIDDIAHYKEHSDCRTLYCFIYDPENRIANPGGLESDLNVEEEALTVRIVVAPLPG